MKNCEPLVSFPRLAMDNRKALSCLRVKFSSVRSRERGIDASECVLWHVIAEIFREKQDKREKSFFPPNHCISNQSFHKDTIFLKVWIVTTQVCTCTCELSHISKHVPKNSILIPIHFNLLEIDYPSIHWLSSYQGLILIKWLNISEQASFRKFSMMVDSKRV